MPVTGRRRRSRRRRVGGCRLGRRRPSPSRRGRRGDVGRALLGLLRLRLQRRQPLLASGRPAGGSLATVAALRRHGRRERCSCRRAPPRGRRRAGRAARRARRAAATSRLALRGRLRASRSFCAVARESPSIPVIASSSEVAPRIDRDRVGLALDVERRAAATRSAAATRASERRTISVRSVASASLLGASSPERAVEPLPARPGRGRAPTRPRRARAAPTTRTGAARRPSTRAGPGLAPLREGVDPVTRRPLEKGRAEQRPREVSGPQGGDRSKKSPVKAGKNAICRDFCRLSFASVSRPCYDPAFAGARREAVPFDDRTSSMNSSRTRQAPALILASLALLA